MGVQNAYSLDNTRIADRHGTSRNRLDDDATGTDDRVLANIRHNHGAVPDPCVAVDHHSSEFPALLTNGSCGIIETMCASAREDIHVAADKDVVADATHADGATSSDIDTMTDTHLTMRQPCSEFNSAIPRKRFQSHEIEAAARKMPGRPGKRLRIWEHVQKRPSFVVKQAMKTDREPKWQGGRGCHDNEAVANDGPQTLNDTIHSPG